MIIDESEVKLAARPRRAQLEYEDLKRKLDEVLRNHLNGYVLWDGLLHKEVKDEIRLVFPKAI